MRIKNFIFGLALSLCSVAASAGAGHNHGHSHQPVDQQRAQAVATQSVQRLADSGKIDKSWKSVSASKAEQKKFGSRMEWVVVFNNDKVADAGKRKLYVFLTLAGEYLAANYTGE